jgi:hypothetical protein
MLACFLPASCRFDATAATEVRLIVVSPEMESVCRSGARENMRAASAVVNGLTLQIDGRGSIEKERRPHELQVWSAFTPSSTRAMAKPVMGLCALHSTHSTRCY